MSESLKLGQDFIQKATQYIKEKNIEEVKRLLNNNPNCQDYINSEDKFGCSLLHKAIEENNIELTEFLLKKGADVNQKDIYHFAPLHKAIKRNNLEIVKKLLLVKGIDINMPDKGGCTSLHRVLIDTNNEELALEIISLLLKKGIDINAKNRNGNTALYFAMQKGYVDVINLLLKNGATLNNINVKRETILHYITEIGGDISIVKNFLKKGANPNTQDAYGQTPLHYAVISGRVDIVNQFLENGADPNIQDKNGQTALHYATIFNRVSIVSELLSSNKIDIYIRDNKGETALDVASKYSVKSMALSTLSTIMSNKKDNISIETDRQVIIRLLLEKMRSISNQDKETSLLTAIFNLTYAVIAFPIKLAFNMVEFIGIVVIDSFIWCYNSITQDFKNNSSDVSVNDSKIIGKDNTRSTTHTDRLRNTNSNGEIKKG